MSRLIRWPVRAAVVWCGVGALVAPPLWAWPAHDLSSLHRDAEVPQRDVHAARGVDFGGKELAADTDRTWRAIDAALGGTVRDGHRVRAAGDSGSFLIDVVPDSLPGSLRYAPVATGTFKGGHDAVVRVSDQASPDLNRQAVTARLTELRTVITRDQAKARPDATSALVEGLLTPVGNVPTDRLSARDIGRVRALQLLARDLPENPDPRSEAGAAALGSALVLGLLDEDPAEPPNTMPENEPLAGKAAAEARATAVRSLDGEAKSAVDKVLALAGLPGAKDELADIRMARDVQRAKLSTATDRAMAGREKADEDLTHAIDGQPELPVFRRVIVGGAWAATVDYLTLDPQPTAGIPPVLAVADGPGMVNNLGDFRLTQPPMDQELPGAPFQPVEFTDKKNDFLFSTAFGRAVGAARVFAGMPTYHAGIARIEARAGASDADGWQPGAEYRLTTTAGRTLYAQQVDVATGLGPARLPFADPKRMAGHTYTDLDSGYQVVYDLDYDPKVPDARMRILDPSGTSTGDRIPESTSWLLGVQGVNGRPHQLTLPHLLDRQGRPTERTVVDVQSGFSVDPVTGWVYGVDGIRVDPGTVDGKVLARLGFFGSHGFRDPRFVAEPTTGLSVNVATGELIVTDTREPISRDSLSERERALMDLTLRSHRVQYGGENTRESYHPRERVYVVGGGAGGASEVEQATGDSRKVTWGVRRPPKYPQNFPPVPRGPQNGLDPVRMKAEYDNKNTKPERKAELERDLTFFFGEGFNRRNTARPYAALSPEVWGMTGRTNDLPVAVRYTTTGSLLVTDINGQSASYDRIVYTIGREAGDPGGAAAVLAGIKLAPLYGVFKESTAPNDKPDTRELNGLRDGSGGLRVLGAAGVARAVVKLAAGAEKQLNGQIDRQAKALPPDAKGITSSIRYHARRIAETNRVYG